MPVTPAGIEPFTIQSPLTTGDNGEPSQSIKKDMLRVFDLIEDERHLTAQDLLHSVKDRLDEWEMQQQAKKEREEAEEQNRRNSSIKKPGLKLALGAVGGGSARRQRQREAEEAEQAAAKVNDEFQQVKNLLKQNRDKFDTLENRCRLFRKAQKNLKEEEEWTLASTMFGIETYYRREADGSLSLKLQGEIEDVPLFEQICVLKEVDLHYKWAPFCSSSLTIADLDKLDTVGWFFIGLSSFGLARDGCFRAIGCDNFQEDGSILLAGQGIQDIKEGAPKPLDTYLCDDPIIEKLDVPPIPSRRGASRMTIHTFDAIIHVTSPTSAVTKIVANVNPNITFLPQSLLEFIMKNLAGVLLAKLQTAAKQVVKHPVTNEHARKMREEEDFYRWVMAKFQAICDLRGWEMPPVGAFEITEEDLLKESKRLPSKRGMTKRSHTFSGTTEKASEKTIEFGSVPPSREDDDMVSALTSQSGRSWRGSPIRFLKHRREERAHRKEVEIQEARLQASERNIPRPLSADEETHLQQLRDAKARQEGADETSMASSSVSTENAATSMSEKITDRLQAQSGMKRCFVMGTVLTVLFIFLNPRFFATSIHVEDFMPDWYRDQTLWESQLLEGMGLVAYLSLCAALHFAACDIMLVYAFNSLDLGKKAGKQVKRYYSDNVRVVVAAMSFGILALSVTKALSRVLLRVTVSWGVTVYHELLSSTSVMQNTTFNASSVMGENATEENSTSDASSSSNGWSESAARGAVAAFKIFAQRLEPLFTSLQSEGEEETLDSWQQESFETARSLFSNTVSPMFVFLLLFGLSARLSQRRTATRKMDDSNKTTETPEHTPDTAEAVPPSPSESTMTNDYSPASSASRKRKMRRLRFRRANHRSEQLATLPENPAEEVQVTARANTM